jgi:drug/metabolite transporter (DMT)-like permease
MSDSEVTTSKSHTRAVFQALLVTFLWSTSWVLVKLGLQARIPAVTFAGLRYTLAFLCLVPFVLSSPIHRNTVRRFSRGTWIQLAILGIVFYTITQGSQFISLAFLPAATVTLLLNFSPVVVALLSGILSNESPQITQWAGIVLSAIGAVVYFLPLQIPSGQIIGLTAALVGVLANSASSLLGRQANRQSVTPPVIVTTISMGIGGFLLFIAGITTQGFGNLGPMQWLIIVWLAVVNTAVAFTLWNHTLRTLTAVESSIINSTMLPQIAILAWLLLGEPLNPRQIIGIILVAIGTLIVQLWYRKPKTVKPGLASNGGG